MAHLGSASQQRMTSMLAIKPIAAAPKSHTRLGSQAGMVDHFLTS